MSACFELQNGVWGISTTAPESCPGYVLLEPADYQTLSSVQSADINAVDLGLAWGFAFSTIMLFWVGGLKIRIANKGINSIR